MRRPRDARTIDGANGPRILPPFSSIVTHNPRGWSAGRKMVSQRSSEEDALRVGVHVELPDVGRLTKIAEDRYEWSGVGDDAEGDPHD